MQSLDDLHGAGVGLAPTPTASQHLQFGWVKEELKLTRVRLPDGPQQVEKVAHIGDAHSQRKKSTFQLARSTFLVAARPHPQSVPFDFGFGKLASFKDALQSGETRAGQCVGEGLAEKAPDDDQRSGDSFSQTQRWLQHTSCLTPRFACSEQAANSSVYTSVEKTDPSRRHEGPRQPITNKKVDCACGWRRTPVDDAVLARLSFAPWHHRGRDLLDVQQETMITVLPRSPSSTPSRSPS